MAFHTVDHTILIDKLLNMIKRKKKMVHAESRKVVNLPPDKDIPEGEPSSQNNRKWAWLGFVIGASIVYRGPSSGQLPCDRNVFLTLGSCHFKWSKAGLFRKLSMVIDCGRFVWHSSGIIVRPPPFHRVT